MSWKSVAAVLAVVCAGAASAGDDASREVQAMKSAKVPLLEAIRLAEKNGGGPAIDAEFDVEGERGEYEIKVLSAEDRQVREFKIDADTGRIIEADQEPFESVFASLKAESILQAPMDLATAVATAQKTSGGIAVEAEVDSERDSVVYSVKLAKGNALEEVRLNAAGKVAAAQ